MHRLRRRLLCSTRVPRSVGSMALTSARGPGAKALSSEGGRGTRCPRMQPCCSTVVRACSQNGTTAEVKKG
jgi:hypothetical protein